ncbi:SDR family NAD(P)-dependent oxidoreductase [Saccharopolyspora mangrovi]|uniref:SDR family NAD(P)-dependent oxidoreductase n=1 Tax=Saccharopolyspora mangrovi TaxID=3082379 RepID=A0ABU6AHM2_9PSEU|nr:SDR family NAD(P)-dependent oxidoreductase [Saccharopolyspora sp. S2-29]MEB3370983.1 SDR family NAD(P)-dependent oxidoreductase [Saccharopolyspora sp. S2-29]
MAVVADRGGDDAEALVSGLRARGWNVRRVQPSGSPDAFDGNTAELEEVLAHHLQGRVDLCVNLLDGQTWDASVRQVAETILVAKHALASLTKTAAAGSRAGFVTVTRLDGGLGLRGGRPAEEALAGGVGGVVKTLAREAPGVFCRALDVDPGVDRDEFVAVLLGEIADAATDTTEVGIGGDGLRWTVVPGTYRHAIAHTDAIGSGTPDVALDADDVLVVTGGARGVTALCVRALAQHTQAEFVLLGRTELTDEPSWAQGVPDDGLKAAAIEEIKACGERPTPREVERRSREQIAQREIRATVDAVRQAGAQARYIAVDVTDHDAVAAALAPLRDRITGVVHGAGVLADAHLTDKTGDEIHRVFRTKLTGLRAILDATDADALRHLVLFTSVAGLLGNAGQADYAAANEALCRLAASWKRRRPDCHVTAIDWGAWDGGMVTPQLREVFHARGVRLLEPEVGAQAFVEQFGSDRVDEVCVLVGEDKSLTAGDEALAAAFTAHRDIAPLADDPVIGAHVVGEHAVLPATFGLGWMIHVVERANPGRRVVEARDFQVYKGILFDGELGGGQHVTVEPAGDATVKVSVRTDTGQGLPVLHYAATLVLSTSSAGAPAVTGSYPLGEGPENGLDIYRDAVLFHGPPLQGLRRVLHHSDDRLVLECRLADTPVGSGAYRGELHSPVLADLLLQGPSVHGNRLLGQASLPLGFGRAEHFAALPGDEPFVLIVDHVRQASTAITVTATACDRRGTVLQRWHDIEMVAAPGMSEKFREGTRRWSGA